jgi:hypothetical protein
MILVHSSPQKNEICLIALVINWRLLYSHKFLTPFSQVNLIILVLYIWQHVFWVNLEFRREFLIFVTVQDINRVKEEVYFITLYFTTSIFFCTHLQVIYNFFRSLWLCGTAFYCISCRSIFSLSAVSSLYTWHRLSNTPHALPANKMRFIVQPFIREELHDTSHLAFT